MCTANAKVNQRVVAGNNIALHNAAGMQLAAVIATTPSLRDCSSCYCSVALMCTCSSRPTAAAVQAVCLTWLHHISDSLRWRLHTELSNLRSTAPQCLHVQLTHCQARQLMRVKPQAYALQGLVMPHGSFTHRIRTRIRVHPSTHHSLRLQMARPKKRERDTRERDAAASIVAGVGSVPVDRPAPGVGQDNEEAAVDSIQAAEVGRRLQRRDEAVPAADACIRF